MYNPIRKYQQGGEANPEQLMQQIAQMLQQQIPPQQIMEQLQQMGIQPQQAQQMIQQVAQSMQQAPEQQPQMQQGGNLNYNTLTGIPYPKIEGMVPFSQEYTQNQYKKYLDFNSKLGEGYDNFDSYRASFKPIGQKIITRDGWIMTDPKSTYEGEMELDGDKNNPPEIKKRQKLEWKHTSKTEDIFPREREMTKQFSDYNITYPNKMKQGGYNPYLLDDDSTTMMKGGMHKMPNGMMMKNSMMQSGGKINYADFPPERTIMKREELYKGANPNMLVYQDTYGDGRKDITYQDKKTGKMMSNPWATNKDSSINRSITGSLDLQNPKFVPMQSVSKMKKGGMKKWSY